MSQTRQGVEFDTILEVAEAKPEGGIWLLAPDEVEELESVGLTVRALPAQLDEVMRRCQVTLVKH